MKKSNLIIIALILGFLGCSEPGKLNQLDSDDYGTKEERIEILKKEIKIYSDFENTEFELFNVNGFSNSRTMVPGASSWDYKFAIKMRTSDIDKWTAGMIEIEPDDYEWMREIVEERNEAWKTETAPEFYSRKGSDVIMIVYKAEGIIFKRIVNF